MKHADVVPPLLRPLWARLRLSRQRLGALLFLVLNLFYASQIPEIQQLPVDRFEAMNARSMPWVLSAAGLLCTLLLWFSGAPRSERLVPAVPPAKVTAADLGIAGALLLWTAAFAWLLGVLGLGISVAVFLVGGFILLGERRLGLSLLIAISFALIFWLLLRFGLGLHIPAGTLWVALGWLDV